MQGFSKASLTNKSSYVYPCLGWFLLHSIFEVDLLDPPRFNRRNERIVEDRPIFA